MSVFSRFTGHFVMFIENCSMAIENIRQNRHKVIPVKAIHISVFSFNFMYQPF